MNIVQIGANSANDDLTSLIFDKQPNKFIIVEPMHIHNEALLACYDWIENKIIENVAISNELIDKINFYYHINDGPKYEVSSLDLNHIFKHNYSEDGIKKIEVPCLTINKLLEKHSINTVDILFVDCEGLDDTIIKAIDFTKFKIYKIYFENLHLKTDLNSFLSDKGYEINKNVGQHGWMNLALLKKEL